MNRLQWIEKLKSYDKPKAINFVLVILICLQLIFSLYLFVPMVSEKAEVKAFVGQGYDNDYGAYGQNTNIITVRLEPKTKYSLKETVINITLKGEDINRYIGYKTIRGESEEFTYGYNEVGKVTGVYIEIISVETESMGFDIFMLCLSMAGVLFGAAFLIGRLRAAKLLPHV